MEMRAIGTRTAGLRRPRQCRHGARAQGRTTSQIAADDLDGLLDFAVREDIDLTIVGPEGPLVAGIVDRFAAARRACFGPCRAAARLEGSKAFSKDFLQRHRIPTASYATFTAENFDPGYMRSQRLPLVVKADGLAAGKGVVICETHESAIAAARGMLEGSFGAAGSTIVVEEFLRGEEVSFIVVAGGDRVVPLATSQDHKRRDDGDQGPNTGGMGAYSPAPVVDAALHARIMDEVIEPTLRGLRLDGTPYTRFPVRRFDDCPRWDTQCPRVQLPIRRSGNPTDSHAAAERSRGSVRSGARGLAR